MAKAISTKDWVYLCMTANFWGSGKTEASAISRCRLEAGSDRFKKAGYILYKVHPDFEIGGVDGTIYTPIGHSPVEIRKRLPAGTELKNPLRKLQCPRCKKTTETTAAGHLSCGDCLMEACEVVQLVDA